MPDYNLSGLSTRSFEQLIQAIAAKVIGPGLIIFGDGSDGGREATFEGSIPYPSKENGWEGYGIVQAKFLQRSQDSQKDGEWALQQLRSELRKFTDQQKPRRKPEYYIFATNVVLTPVQDAGSKDKAYALINEFKQQVPLKDYDIWDYDKIRTLLDGEEDIRRGYAAWITPGDVLAQVIEWLKPQPADFEQIIANFLQKELFADLYANLEQAGHVTDERIPLARVFVDLPVSNERLVDPPRKKDVSQGFLHEILQVAAERLDSESTSLRNTLRRVSEGLPSIEPGRFVLLGGPGQGKTTVGQFICQLFRASILGDKIQRLSPEVRTAIEEITAQCQEENIQQPLVRRFPIRIVLSEFATALAAPESSRINSLLSYMVERIRRRTDREVSSNDLRQWLANYPWVLILDGLDEVPASSNRDRVLAAVREFWVDVADCNADVLIVATSRPQGYNQDFSPELYRNKWLVPLSPLQAMHYARRLVNVRYTGDQDRKEKILTRLQRASSHDTTARLMRSPLQITIMATLVDRMGQPPQERWSLFKEYYNVIYQREMERNIPAASILRDYKPDIDAIHNRVGLLLQVESERSGRTDARLPANRFATLVEGRLVEEGHEGQMLQELQKAIMQAATDRLVFLVGLEAGEVGFEIRSLQEFMAAEGLMEGSDQIVRDRLREIAPIANWRNVFLFAAGKCFSERQHLRDTIHMICAELNEIDEDSTSSIVLVGSQLALDLLEDGPARRQPLYAQSLARLALRLLELPPSNLHLRLADLYAPSLESVYLGELTRHLSRNAVEQRLGAWATLIPLTGLDLPWAEELSRTYWPKYENEQRDLVWVAQDSRPSPAFASALIEALPHLSPKEIFERLTEFPAIWAQQIPKTTWLNIINLLVEQRIFAQKREIPLYLTVRGKNIFRLLLQLIQEDESHWLISANSLGNANPEWLPFVAGAQFQENPSSQTLAKALRTIAERPTLQQVNWSAELLPWPLGSCLAASKNSQQLSELSKRVEKGDLGDLNDWLEAEARWRKEGVTEEDIVYMTDAHWPFDKAIARHGFPFAVASFSIFVESGREELLLKLFDLYERQKASKIRSNLANIILFLLGTFVRVSKGASNLVTPEQFRKLGYDVKEGIDLAGLNLFEWKDDLDNEWADFFNSLGEYDRVHLFKISESLSIHLSKVFCKDPSRVGILKLLSLFTKAGTSPEIPQHLLNPAYFSDQKAREAAILIRMGQENLEVAEAETLAEHVTELAIQTPGIVAEVLQIISDHNLTGPGVEQFLITSRRRLPPTQWEPHSKINTALNDILHHRTSRLGNPPVWSKLKLPKGLGELVQQ